MQSSVCRDMRLFLVAAVAAVAAVSASTFEDAIGKLCDDANEASDIKIVIDCSTPEYSALKGNELPSELPKACKEKQLQIKTWAAFKCDLKGTIPDWISTLTELTVFSVTGRCTSDGCEELDFDITTAFSKLTKLTALEMYSELITGDITCAFSELTKLTELSVSGPKLEGDIGTAFSGLTELETLIVFGDKLTGDKTCAFSELTKLKILGVIGPSLKGEIECPTPFFSDAGFEFFTAAGEAKECKYKPDAESDCSPASARPTRCPTAGGAIKFVRMEPEE